MKIFVGENIPVMTVRALREMGHTVTDVRDTDVVNLISLRVQICNLNS